MKTNINKTFKKAMDKLDYDDLQVILNSELEDFEMRSILCELHEERKINILENLKCSKESNETTSSPFSEWS